MIAKRADPWLSATLLVVSIATLGRAMQVGDGILKEGTIPWLAIAFVACLAGVLLPAPSGRTSYGRAELLAAIGAVLFCEWGQILARVPFNEIDETSEWFAHFRWGAAGMGLLVGSMLLARGWARHVAFILFLATYVLLATSVIRAAPSPNIDVFMFQRDAAQAFAKGINPYSITFPDIIGTTWYGEGISVDGRLQFGYPYMPLTLLLALPGELLAGDYRYSLLGAIVLSAAMIAYVRPGTVSFAAAAMLLLVPRSFYILERGWSDPFVVLMLCASVFCAVRLPRVIPWLLGLYFVSKQYVPVAAGAALLLIGQPFSWRAAGSLATKAAVAACTVTLPLVLWDLPAFWNSAVTLQFRQVYRWDSLNFVAWWMQENRVLPRAALLLPIIAVIVGTVAVLRRCERSAAGFAAGTALVLFLFFAFNKQAFGNYYYVVIAAMSCAVATAVPGTSEPK